jgi:SWI/SNF-related matrix-associated actin-dependent regulator of chromatin subfamily A member 5
MDDWQFYNKARLTELTEMENKLFEELVDSGNYPGYTLAQKLVLLPPDLQEEKTRLLAEAFGDWSKLHFNSFIRASAKCGRTAYDKIAKEVGRPTEEVKRYAEAFARLGPQVYSPADWERYIKQIEKVRI